MVDRGEPRCIRHRGGIAQSLVAIEHGIEGLGQLLIWQFGLGPVVQHRVLERVVGRTDAFPQRRAPVQLRSETLAVTFRLSLRMMFRSRGPACKGPERGNGCGSMPVLWRSSGSI